MISPAVRDAMRRVANSDTHIVISTGRSMLGTASILADLELPEGIALCSNGAVKLDTGSGDALTVETFDPAPVYRELAARLPGAIFAAEQVGIGSLVTSPFSPHHLHGPQQVASISELIGSAVPKMIANWVGHEPSEVRDAVADALLPSCTYTLDHYEPWVTVVPSGVTKGSALEKLRAELDISASETLAAGDGENDITMLEWAAHGVAMGQAPPTVLAAADEVAAPVGEDGLVAILDRWFP